MTQTEAILADLRRGAQITPGEALRDYGCFRLAARIIECRERLAPGERIVNAGAVTSGGARVARYVLVRDAAQLELPL